MRLKQYTDTEGEHIPTLLVQAMSRLCWPCKILSCVQKLAACHIAICIHKAALIKTLPWTFHIRKALWHDCLGFWYNYMKEPLICYSVCVVILWPWNKHIETATVIGTLDNESFCAEYHAAGKDCVQNGYFFLTSINLVHCRLLHYTVFPKS